MIFQLIQVKGKIDRIYDVPLVFFENVGAAANCNDTLFPNWFRPVYRRSPGLKERFDAVFKIFKKTKKKHIRLIINLCRRSRDIQSICDNIADLYPELDQIDKKLREPLKNLFEFLFDSTIGTDIFREQTGMHIDDHYNEFINKNSINVCPFCGLETYTLPKFRRAEYDHYLPISKVPWLGVNLNNLAPMGDHCNGKKNQTNPLYTDYVAKTRRMTWYPYEWFDYSVALNATKAPSFGSPNGEWEVVFNAGINQSKLETWCTIFEIPLRFKEFIRTYHKKILQDFAHKNEIYGQRLSIIKLKEELVKYKDKRIGDIRFEPNALLKYLWADYYYKTPDMTQLALIVQGVAMERQRINPLVA